MAPGFEVSVRPAVVCCQRKALLGASSGATGLIKSEPVMVIQTHHLADVRVTSIGFIAQDYHPSKPFLLCDVTFIAKRIPVVPAYALIRIPFLVAFACMV